MVDCNMANLKNHNFKLLKLRLSKNRYWDYFLNKDKTRASYVPCLPKNGVWNDCLVSEINPNIEGTTSSTSDIVKSSQYMWENAICENVRLDDIGLTGLDNGFVEYDPETDVLKDLFLNSQFSIEDGTVNFFMSPVNGYFDDITYNKPIVEEEYGIKSFKFDNGFYQGFYRLEMDKGKYQTLPNRPNVEMAWEFVIKPSSSSTTENTLNEIYPDNSGTFFYIGTRAENKFWYCSDQTQSDMFEFINEEEYIEGEETYCSLSTSDGIPLSLSNLSKISSDNKYLFFGRHINSKMPNGGIYYDKESDKTTWINRGLMVSDFESCLCHTVRRCEDCNREKQDKFYDMERILLQREENKNAQNKFITYNRTPCGIKVSDSEGITKQVCGIDAEGEKYNNDIDILQDLYYNALAFQITDSGAIGYKYLVRDCSENREKDYKIESGFSFDNIVKMNEWNHIVVRLITNEWIENPECDNGQRKCKLYFYVNGKLKFISKELKEPIFKKLDEINQKQEAVPFNISLGGGTIGLRDMIMADNKNYIKRYLLPLEENFAGTFNGNIMTFRIHNCPMDYTKVLNNYCYYMNYLGQSFEPFYLTNEEGEYITTEDREKIISNG